MKLQTLLVPVEWMAANNEENVLEGYASTFGNIDFQYDVIAPGAFKNTIPAVRGGDVPLLADHNVSVRNVLGTLIDAREDAKGLRIKAKFASDPDAQAIRQKMLDGHVKKMSIGYQPLQWRYETRDDARIRVLEDIRLWEVSAVVFPANPQAVIDRVKSAVRQTVDAVVAGAVTNGADEHEIKAALADWANQHPFTGEAMHTQGFAKPEDKAAIPPHSTATKSEALDAGRQGEYSRLARHLRDTGVDVPDLTKVETTHLETGAAKTPEGAEPDQDHGSDAGPDSLTLAMRRADAVLAGRDPDETADPVKLAGIEVRLELLDKWVERRTREV